MDNYCNLLNGTYYIDLVASKYEFYQHAGETVNISNRMHSTRQPQALINPLVFKIMNAKKSNFHLTLCLELPEPVKYRSHY